MEGLKEAFDLKTILLVAALGGGLPLGQYLGYTAPAKFEIETVTPLVMEAQSRASEALERVAKCHAQLAACQERCGEGSP